MRFDLDKLAYLGEQGYLRRQRHPEADLWIYNYTEQTQYEGKWTHETLSCRGLILDAEGEVVARPFPKFFNYGDPNVGEIPAEPFTVTEKVDGSLGIYYLLDGQPCIATRGSFTSPQALEGTRMLLDHELVAWEGTTPLFEIVFPANRIVVDYGERRALVLLTAIDHETGRDMPVPVFSGERVEQHDPAALDELANHQRPNCEGYVVTFQSGLRVKVKHSEYVRLHRIITGVNARHIWDALRNGQDPTTELDGVPDEVYGWIERVVNELDAAYRHEADVSRQVFELRPRGADRRAVAEFFKGANANTAVLFRMLDGKPYDDLIWKAIRPEPTTPDTIWTQEVAA